MKTNNKMFTILHKFTVIIFIILLSCISSLLADVTVTTKVSMSTFGSLESSILIKEYISGNMYCYQIQELPSEIELASDQFIPSDAIIASVDNKTISLIDYDNQTYDAMPLKSFGEIKKLTMVEWPPDVIEQIGWAVSFEEEIGDKINGYDCFGVKAIVTGINKADSLQKIVVISEQWKTSDSVDSKEYESVRQILFDSTGTDLSPINTIIEDMSYRYYPHFDSLALRFDNLKSFMIKSTIAIRIESNLYTDKLKDIRARNIYDEAVEMMRYINQQTGRENNDGKMTIFSLSSNVIDVNFNKIDTNVFIIPKEFTKIAE